MTLYQLTDEAADLANRLGDEPTDADLEAIGTNEEAFRAKAASYVAVWRTLETEAETMRLEARRLSELAAKRENGADRLKRRIAWALDTLGIDKLPTELGRLSVANASRPSIRWDGDLADLPDGFRKIETKLDSDAALDSYKAGTLPKGFSVKTSRYVRVS